MLTHYDVLAGLMSLLIGMMATLIGLIWKARGWVDERTAVERQLTQAIEALTRTTQDQHRENQQRFLALEHRKGWRYRGHLQPATATRPHDATRERRPRRPVESYPDKQF